VRADHQHQPRGGEQRERRELLKRIVGDVLVQVRVRTERRGRPEEQRVTVRRSPRGFPYPDAASLAGLVLYQHRLPQRRLQVVPDQSCDRVRDLARRERHDDADDLRRILPLRERRQGAEEQRSETQEAQNRVT
jgi:hypothetical protein